MANGWDQDWQSKIIDEVAAHNTRIPRRSIGLNYPLSMHSAILAACRARGMSLTSFNRRAMMAVVSYDLGLDWATLMADEPNVQSLETSGAVLRNEPGYGDFGPWRIMSMEDYRDERH